MYFHFGFFISTNIMYKFSIPLFVILICLSACGTKKNLSLIEETKSEFVMPDLKSTINVRYKIDSQAINDTFNTVIDSYLDGEMAMMAMGMDVTVKKEEDASIEFLERSKNSFLANIKASGKLTLQFVTEIDVDSSWNLVTMTTLNEYNWKEEPKLSVGGLNLSIGTLANNIIEKSKSTFEKQIDAAVAEQLEIRSKVLETMKYVEAPILVDTLLNSWVHFEPTNVYMSRLENLSGYSSGNLTIHGKTKINDKKPKLQKSGEKLVVVSDVSGSVNGQLLVSAIPRFDNSKQAFFADDIDIDVKTKNVIHKAGAWMFKSKIKNKLKEMMHFSIADNLSDIQNTIDDQIKDYQVKDKLDINVDLKKINVNRFVLDVDRARAFITLNVYLETIIHDMSAFNNQPKKLE